ncbi:hypothetical protein M404DRAFT_29932 [Pisolithus tinctorius Marx 270]|uniref:Uncharacterized protein n=1 Tax=Pisolithus tinctorius Marx 270 TaxID=870435 RepID=A0A0C3NXL8_PISTI|nr:hypothetical protein M404DRAFT_29932 [Pisolithus tinctorius Marx 270]
MVDINPRPQKRLRTDPNLVDSPETASDPHCPSALLSSASVPLSRPPPSPGLKPLPPHVLLLALPALLLHPPTHEKYALSLFLSLKSIRLCLQLPALAPDVECYAWTALAEVGMRVIRSGFCKTGEHDWTMGLEEEVEKAIGKGVSSDLCPSLITLTRVPEALTCTEGMEDAHIYEYLVHCFSSIPFLDISVTISRY